MKPVKLISGQMAPMPRSNVDTDQIMPKEHLKRVERTGFGPFLFHDWAVDQEGKRVMDFVLNRPEYSRAIVLITGPNFGCGSSREHAPWGLEDWGFKAIVAPSFADIFYNNCVNIGLVPVVLTEEEVSALTAIAANPLNTVTIDVEMLTVVAPRFEAAFELDSFTRYRLLEGLDNIALTLENTTAIREHELARQPFKPVL